MQLNIGIKLLWICNVVWAAHPCNVSNASLSANFPAYTSVPLWFCMSDQQLPLWLPAQSHRGIKEDWVSVKCMADLANLHIVQEEGAISASSSDKDMTNSVQLSRGAGWQTQKLWWKTMENNIGKDVSVYPYISSQAGIFQRLIRLLCVYVCILVGNGKWDAYWYTRLPTTVRKK